MRPNHHVWISRQARNRMEAELVDLLAVRADDDTTDWDLHQARKARIWQIQDLLMNAAFDEIPPDDGVAEPGMILTVRFDGSDETETFLLGTPIAELGDLEVCSAQSPLGDAIAGARPGEQRTYRVPSGALVSVTLLDAAPYGVRAADKAVG
ncbi:MAG: GreA/GreB family elongation factor [Mycobacterium sp.]